MTNPTSRYVDDKGDEFWLERKAKTAQWRLLRNGEVIAVGDFEETPGELRVMLNLWCPNRPSPFDPILTPLGES